MVSVRSDYGSGSLKIVRLEDGRRLEEVLEQVGGHARHDYCHDTWFIVLRNVSQVE